MDKDVAKKLLQSAKIPVVPWVTVQRAEWERHPKEIQSSIEKTFKYPVFVKPATLGSSVGMTKVHSRAELAPALNLAAEFAMRSEEHTSELQSPCNLVCRLLLE